MTSRDIEIIDFLNRFKCATTSMLSILFFPSVESCYKTMRRLYKAGKVKRIRLIKNSINCDYVYHTKSITNQMKHSLTITWFYTKWKQKYKVELFEREYKLGDIVSDAVVIYSENGIKKVALVEAELSNKGFNYMKYERFYTSGEYKNYFPVMPDIIVLGKVTVPTGTHCKYILYQIDEYYK